MLSRIPSKKDFIVITVLICVVIGALNSSKKDSSVEENSTVQVKTYTSNIKTNAHPCTIKEARLLGVGNNPSFSPDDSKIVFNKKDTQNIYQLFISNPDGSDVKCISCAASPGSPRVDRHKTGPSWHPSGKYIIFSGEMDKHPAMLFNRIDLITELYVNGLWSNIYAVTPDGKSWYRLTDYSIKKEDGAMHINVSPDGSKIAWSRMIEKSTDGAQFGKWQLLVGDFIFNTTGKPSIKNIRNITPENAQLIEAHGFSPDNRYLIFTGDMQKRHDWDMDIWTIDLITGKLKNLTKGAHWEEHATYSPTGKSIAYMSSVAYPFDPILKTELFVMNADGTQKRQISRFNVEGSLEYTTDRSMATSNDWNSDGTQIAVTQQFSWKYPSTQMWVFKFAGLCGK